MAITPTGAIFKTLSFDGKSLRSYGVYISGEATFNAPAREVEMISIPGRSGQLALDKGRFENIEVTYPAGIYADTEADFAEAVSELRNFLCSRSGYCRIEDDYNPNEFRMGIYKSGLEVTPALLKAGEFDLVFDCKPQRWLKSGEDEIEVQDGDTITNPTLFECGPLLLVDGYGIITINGINAVEITGGAIGQYLAKEGTYTIGSTEDTFEFDDSLLNIGDAIGGLTGEIIGCYMSNSRRVLDFSVSQTGDAGVISGADQIWNSGGITYFGCKFTCDVSTNQFLYGTPRTDNTVLTTLIPTNSGDVSATVTCTVNYDGIKTISMGLNFSATGLIKSSTGNKVDRKDLYAYSSQSALGNPLYIDCDIGEAYKIEGGVPISINNGVSLGSDLPKLISGANTITFDNTITDLKIVPRWWIV